MGKFYILFFLILTYYTGFGQKEAYNWYFGQNAGISFNSGTATAVTDGKLTTFEGCSSISDANGNLLFYTDGRKVWNKNHVQMLNSFPTLLKGDPSSTQSGIIIPKPGSSTAYYIFTVDMQAGMALIAGDVDGTSNGMMYSEVDMTADSGRGAIVLLNKNLFITKPTTEGLTAVKDADGTGYWVVTHGVNNNSYMAYHITSSGVNTTPVISNSGPVVSATPNYPNFGGGAAGYMKISPNGEKIAACHYRENKEVVISDFNAATGVVSNSVSGSINYNFYSEGPYGVEFSNCNEYLYVTEDFTTFRPDSSASYPLESRIWRFDLNAANIIASKSLFQLIPNELVGGLQLAPDGKIYCSKWIRTGTDSTNYNYGYGNHLHTINNPRLSTATFTTNAISLAGKKSTSGLPPFISSFFYNSSITATNLSNGDTSLFCSGDSVLFKVTTSSYDSIRWSFGDPGSGVVNNTSTQLTPKHLFSASGIYQVKLLKYLCGIADTSKKNITFTKYPVINDLTDITVCSGTTVQLNATSNPATSYLWNTGATTPIISSDSTGKYIVTVSNNGCKSKDSMFLKEIISATAAVSISSDLSNSICNGSTVLLTANPDASLPSNGIAYQWYKNGSPLNGDTLSIYSTSQVNNGDIYKVKITVDNSNTCLSGADTATNLFPITVKPIPVMSAITNQLLCVGESTAPVVFSSNLSSTTFFWRNSNTSVGIDTSGTGNIPSFTAYNGSTQTQTAIITVTPSKNGCDGLPQQFTYTVNECSLPVELVNFDGKKIDALINNLYWTTASEYNSDYFILEYSQDITKFKEIYKVKGAGFSNQLLNYNYQHNNVPEGINYYRLKQIDTDGRYKYSDIVKIINKNDTYHATVFPNPATNSIAVIINNPVGMSQIIIYDALGQIMQKKDTPEYNNQLIEINISDFANGIYYINISDNKNKTTIPLIKQ